MGFAWGYITPTTDPGSGAHLCCFGDTFFGAWDEKKHSTSRFKSPQDPRPLDPFRTENINDLLVTKNFQEHGSETLGDPVKRIILPSLSLGISTLFLGLESLTTPFDSAETANQCGTWEWIETQLIRVGQQWHGHYSSHWHPLVKNTPKMDERSPPLIETP